LKPLITFLNAYILISALMLGFGCSERPVERVRQTNAYPAGTFDVAQLEGLRLKEMLVVLFQRDFSVEEWKTIFVQTKKLSLNKKVLRSLEGAIDPAADLERGNRMAENAELLEALGNQSSFLMSWSLADENCRFVNQRGVRMTCRPKNRQNPLNGGLPSPVGLVEWVEPNPVVSDTKSPHLKLVLATQENPKFEIELRLKLESTDRGETWWKGEAYPSAGSEFMAPDGVIRPAGFPIGYAEITLGK
jgi:hypothetical protein